MSLLDETRDLYAEYMDEGNEKADEAAMHYAELHPRIQAVLEAAERVVNTKRETVDWHFTVSAAAYFDLIDALKEPEA